LGKIKIVHPKKHSISYSYVTIYGVWLEISVADDINATVETVAHLFDLPNCLGQEIAN